MGAPYEIFIQLKSTCIFLRVFLSLPLSFPFPPGDGSNTKLIEFAGTVSLKRGKEGTGYSARLLVILIYRRRCNGGTVAPANFFNHDRSE